MELRKDYILDRWIIYAPSRKARPKEFKTASAEPVVESAVQSAKDLFAGAASPTRIEKTCYFCLGNESMTPPEVQRIPETNEKGVLTGRWVIRAFPNKFPFVGAYKEKMPRHEKYLASEPCFGAHEVIAETNDHSKQLFDLSAEDILKVIKMYKERMLALYKRPSIKYVTIFKNHGREGGTSIVHSHTQVVGYNKIPMLVKEEISATKKIKIEKAKADNKSAANKIETAKKHKYKHKCAFCEIAEKETASPRFITQNNTFTAICPYASRFNYEAWILPKKHIKSLTAMNEEQLKDLASILSILLKRIKLLNCSYNYYLHTSPKSAKDGELHFHIEICPRIATWAGFELSNEEVINTVFPEIAAEFYRSNENEINQN